MGGRIDLGDVPVVDNHCHPVEARQSTDPAAWREYFTESPDFRMRTEDVVHAFWVPAVRFKADAWPDTTRTFDLVFPEGETLSGHCAQYCGLKHSDMVFTVDAMAPADFRAWVARARG